MPKGDYKKTKDSIVPLRGVVRDGVLASLLDHNGAELGFPVTGTKDVTGEIGLSASGSRIYKDDLSALALAYPGREFLSTDGVTIGNSGTAATTSIDSASPWGVPALKVAAPAGNTWVEVGVNTLTVPNFNANGNRLVWMVWVEDCTKVAKIWSYAGTSGYGRYLQTSNDYLINDSADLLHNGGHSVAIHAGNAPTNTLIDADTVTDSKIRIWAAEGQAFNVWVKGVYVPTKQVPFVCMTFDDNSVGFKTFASTMEKYGLRGTFGLNTTNIGTNDALYVKWSDVDALVAAGHQVCSHNAYNLKYITNQTLAQYMTDYRATRNALLARGYQMKDVQMYHPFVQGGHDPALIAAMRSEGVKISRTTKGGNVEPFGRQYCSNIVPNRELTQANSLASMIGWLDQAEKYGQDFWTMGHLISESTPGAVTWLRPDFDALCAEVASRVAAGRMQAGTVKQWARARGIA